jgi:hypothetical protein
MRLHFLRSLVAVACVAFTCCDKASAQQASIDVYAVQIATTMLDTTTTLGVWRKSNPGDTLSSAYPLFANDLSFCRASIESSSHSNHHTTRFAVFTILPPLSGQLPADTINAAERICRLTTILLQTEEMDSASAAALNAELTKAIDAKLGDYTAGTRLTEGTTQNWSDSKTWSKPRSRVVLATVNSRSGHRVILEAYSQINALTDKDFFTANWEQFDRERIEAGRTSYQDADSAIKWADLPSIGKDLQTMLAELERVKEKSDTLRNSQADLALVRAVIATRDTAPHLEPKRRAAALLAADLVRYATVPFPPPPRSPAIPLYETLQSLITESAVRGFDPANAFSRPWLWKAYELDSLGRVGHLAFVRLLARGFNPGLECARDVEFYRTMIDRGEADLRRGDTDPRVHFYLAMAYKAIFDLSQTTPGDYVDSVPPKSQGEAARLVALDHFRAALASLQSKAFRQEALTLGARLLVRKPTGAWHFCASEED